MADDPEKERFLMEFGQDYGYPNAPKNVDEIRATEFKRLNGLVFPFASFAILNLVYLDHAGATLYSESQMEDVFKDLNSTLYGNPHSQSNCSLTTGDIVGEARRQTLSFFNASPGEYKCIFTSGATAALKLVGETFPWSSQSTFMYTMENHNSVLGIREYALKEGAAAIAVDIEDGKSAIQIIPHTLQRRGEVGCRKKEQTSDTYNLFAFPSECNFSGLRFDLGLVNAIKEDSYEMPGPTPSHSGRWMVLIDAAKGSATSPPDLSKYKADFVVVSFYKLFGYPTGIGALIARNGKLPTAWHTMSLALYVRKALLNLRHVNGSRVCTLYGVNDLELLCNEMGPTVSFNLQRPDGSWFGYREVEKLASLSNIQLRTGCFCNPGACAKHLGLSHPELLSNIEAGHVCWDDHDILNGKPTGSVRVSFGYMSTFEDARTLLKFIKSSFVALPPQPMSLDLLREKPFPASTEGVERVATRYFLKSITVYPIKSCAGFTVESWPLCSTGLLHDREWLLKSLSGEILTQKKVPEMGFITTLVDLKLGQLIVGSLRCKEKLQIELTSDQCIDERQVMEIYSQRYEVQGYGNEVDTWFSTAVGRPCTLVRSYAFQNHMCSNKNRSMGICRDLEAQLNFVNEAQFLLISEESVADLNNRLRSKLHKGSNERHIEVDPSRFRPNLVVSGGKPYIEDGWRSLKIGQTNFTSVGGCNRCQMINMTFTAGTVQRSNEPLATLASYRRLKVSI
ncbi:UNVERIFIED_CONTAM: Molybdenum cofactor sulfurase [Sesamum calycinum]|uniref:Molybdenum cofactor sulfurase n=1 Tax=Sesamum calycinum TaxID=2727403 RepID=A0AAW2Q5G7_9LAMI